MSRYSASKYRFPKAPPPPPTTTRVSDQQHVIDEFPDGDDEMFDEFGLQKTKNQFATSYSVQKDKFTNYSKNVVQTVMTSSGPNSEVTSQKQKRVTSGQQQPLHQTASFLTASVSTVKQWSRYRDEIPMLIEVFGILECLKVVDPQKRYAKQFQLQDQGGSLVCNFYEIDRPIPKVDIGQILRCVGIVQRDGTLLCVSIRPATNEEYQLRNKLMAISAKAMYNRMAKRNET